MEAVKMQCGHFEIDPPFDDPRCSACRLNADYVLWFFAWLGFWQWLGRAITVGGGKEHCPRRLMGESLPPHMPCDRGDFSRD